MCKKNLEKEVIINNLSNKKRIWWGFVVSLIAGLKKKMNPMLLIVYLNEKYAHWW